MMKPRRRFLKLSGAALAGLALGRGHSATSAQPVAGAEPDAGTASRNSLRLCLAGDVMLGRGIDQVLPHPGDPSLYEDYARSALEYVALAETANGAIPKPVPFDYVWGDALAEMLRPGSDARIINLETSVTTSDEPWPGKGIHYRMHPRNVGCLRAARIDCCVLSNNHVLDWGSAGLLETLQTLNSAGVESAGAGLDLASAGAPASLETAGGGRILVFGYGLGSSGIPPEWTATDDSAGVRLLPNLADQTVAAIADEIRQVKQPGDVVVASLHWGGNWGYAVPREHRRFAHRLIDEAAVDVVHGHSSHHPMGIEVHQDRLILYGSGDLLNDYEGISGHEAFRPELTLLYFPTLDGETGRLLRLEMAPFRVRRFRLQRATDDEASWLREILARESARFGTSIGLATDGTLRIEGLKN